jgi:hypothetical protein
MYPLSDMSAAVMPIFHRGHSSVPTAENPERDHAMPYVPLTDDDLVARLLIHTWMLTTGRTLRSDIQPHELAEEELINFWADDHLDQATRDGPSSIKILSDSLPGITDRKLHTLRYVDYILP